MKKEHFLRTLLVSLMVLFSAGILFAGGQEEAAGAADTKIVDYYLQDEPQILDPQVLIGNPDMVMVNMFVEGLTRFGKVDGEYVPGVAKSWTYNEEENSYTFILRDNAYWSNGDKVTTKDFTFSWRRAMDEQTPYSFMISQYIKGADEYAAFTKKEFLKKQDSAFRALTSGEQTDDVKNKITDRINAMTDTELRAYKDAKDVLWNNKVGVVVDGNTMTVSLASPCPYFIGLTAFPVFYPTNPAFYEAHSSEYGMEPEGLISNGPWKVTSWKHNDAFVLTKNENYWNKENIALDTLNIKIVVDVETRTNLLKTGKLDGSAIQAKDLPDFQDLATLEQYNLQELVDRPDFAVFYLEFNHKDNPITKNENIRKAFAYAMNRTEFVQKINLGDNQALGYVPLFFPGLKESFRAEIGKELFQDNRKDLARKHLEMGLKELGLSELPPQDLLMGTADIHRKIHEKFQADWAEAGITVNLVPLPWAERMNRLSAGDFGIFSSGWGPDYMDPMSYLDLFETGNGNNHGEYSNPEYDALISAARMESNPETRMSYLYKAEKMLIDDMVLAPMYFRMGHWTFKNYLTGVVVRGAGPTTDFYWADVDMAAKRADK